MLLDVYQAPAYLLNRGFLTSEDVVAGLTAADVSMRNLNFRVERPAAPGFLLKQAQHAGAEGFSRTEAAVYGLLAGLEGVPLEPYLPRLLAFDAESDILAFELLSGAEDFERHQQRTGRVPGYTMAALARALARLHAIDESRVVSSGVPLRGPAWPLTLHRLTLENYAEMSWGDLEVVRKIQAHSEFGRLLDNLASEWASTALIHHDLKWENCLLVPGTTSKARRLKIIDWEFAGWGDPAWDVGSVFAGFLTSWVRSMRIDEGTSASLLPATATHPLEKMHPQVRAFWSTYVRETGLGQDGATFLLKSVRMSAGRLLESALAETQQASGVNAYALLFLQLAFNILSRPSQAQTLLGVSSIA